MMGNTLSCFYAGQIGRHVDVGVDPLLSNGPYKELAIEGYFVQTHHGVGDGS